MDYQHGRTGHFYTCLFAAMIVADTYNLEKLKKAFPAEVETVRRWRFETGYGTTLEATYNAKKENNVEAGSTGEDAGSEG